MVVSPIEQIKEHINNKNNIFFHEKISNLFTNNS